MKFLVTTLILASLCLAIDGCKAKGEVDDDGADAKIKVDT
jgi:hypothetical protein